MFSFTNHKCSISYGYSMECFVYSLLVDVLCTFQRDWWAFRIDSFPKIVSCVVECQFKFPGEAILLPSLTGIDAAIPKSVFSSALSSELALTSYSVGRLSAGI